MSLTLSADHRVFDGQVGGTVLFFFALYLFPQSFPFALCYLPLVCDARRSREVFHGAGIEFQRH